MRQPAARVADHLHVGDRRRHGRPGSGPPRPTGGRPPRWPPPPGRAARPRRRRRPARSRSRGSARAPARRWAAARPTGCRCGPPARRRPGGPPHLCALADSSDQPAGTGTRPSDCAASVCSGTPARAQAAATSVDRLHGADLVVGAHQAGQGGAGRGDRGAEGGRVDPAGRSTGTPTASPPAATCRSAACRTQECSTAECTSRLPARRRPARPPRTASWAAWVPEAQKVTSSGRAPSHLGHGRAGAVEQQPGAPAGPVEPGRVGPAVVQRGAAAPPGPAGCSGAADAASR